MANKATKAQIEQRVRAVYELLLLDTPYIDICRYVSKNWSVTTRTTDRYIKKANKLIAEDATRMRQSALEKHLVQRAFIRNKALKEGDKRLAFDILRDESKLLDLYHSPTNKNINIDIDLDELTNDQLERIADGDDPLVVIATSGKSQA
jgi:hypothetical protein